MLHASGAGHIIIVQKLLSFTLMFSGRYLDSSLLASIKGNHEQVASMLLNAGADPSAKCVAGALDIKNLELVNLLLDADVVLKDFFGAVESCEPGPEACPCPLLVLRATNLGAYSIVERLIESGSDVDEFCQSSESGTPLVAAVRT